MAHNRPYPVVPGEPDFKGLVYACNESLLDYRMKLHNLAVARCALRLHQLGYPNQAEKLYQDVVMQRVAD